MSSSNKFIHQRDFGIFKEVQGDRELFFKIARDMMENAGDLAPTGGWHFMNHEFNKETDEEKKAEKLNEHYNDKAFEQLFSDANKILGGWVGGNGLVPIEESHLGKWGKYLDKVDHLGLMENVRENKEGIGYKVTDLGSVMDVNLITAYAKKAPLTVLEVGGGYGRLTEAMSNIHAGSIKYVMVDAVPASIMYSYLYLKSGGFNVGIYYDDPSFDMDKYDIYIIPAWHFEEHNKLEYDVCVNIESMQEMNQTHVDHYLNLFNKVLKDDGIAYISNAHDYLFRGEWNYPENWSRLGMFNTPRSWSPHHPTEIFQKSAEVDPILRNIEEAAYDYNLVKLRNRKEVWKHYKNLKNEYNKMRVKLNLPTA